MYDCSLTNLLSMFGSGCGSYCGYGSYSSIGSANLINSLFCGVEDRNVFATNSNGSIKNNNWSTGSIIGLAFGLAAAVVGGFVGINALNNHQTRQTEQQNAVNTATNNNKKIEELSKQIETLTNENKTLESLKGDVNSNLSKLETYCSTEVTAYRSAKSNYDSKKTAFDNLDATNAGESKAYKDKIAAQKAIAEDASKPQADRDAANALIKEYEAQWTKERVAAESAMEKAKTAMDEAKDKLVAAIDKKIADNAKKIKEKQAEMERLQKEAEEALQSERLSRKCDEQKEYDKIIKSDNPSQRDLERAFSYKFREYCNSTPEKKEEKRQEALKVYDTLFKKYGATISDEIRTKYNILKNREKPELAL